MRRIGAWDPRAFFRWALVGFGLCMSLWQGWSCTLRYLAKPVMVEDQFVNLDSLPNIQISFCKKVSIAEPITLQANPTTPQTVGNGWEDYIDANEGQLVGPGTAEEAAHLANYLPPGTILTFANSSQAFWQDVRSREEFQLRKFIVKLEFWNGTSGQWEAIYAFEESGANYETGAAEFASQFYPYEGNSTLLCHTLKTGLTGFGNRFRIFSPISHDGELSFTFCNFIIMKVFVTLQLSLYACLY